MATTKLVLLFALLLPAALNSAATVAEANDGELLYNGIVLPKVWPPQDRDPSSDEPMPVPYLAQPPRVVPIDVGRQLFVDDFLIQSTDMKRTFHRTERFAGKSGLQTADT